MPSLSLDAELDALLAESREESRYRDMGINIRCLTISRPVPEKTELVDDAGRVWVAGTAGPLGQWVWSKKRGESTAAADGIELRPASGSGRPVDLRATTLIAAGGQWDSQKRCWRLEDDGRQMGFLRRVPAQSPVVVDITPAQYSVTAWFAGRLAAFRERRPHPQTGAFVLDKRRGGKTWICWLLEVVALIDCPAVDGQATEGWLITQNIMARDEIERELRDIIPAAWFTFRELPMRQFTFCSGAKLSCKTSTDPESLRVGRADWIMANELPLMGEKAFRIFIRALQDKAGVFLATGNKADARKQNYAMRLWQGAEEDERAGNVPAVALHRCPEELNPYADKNAKTAILGAMRYAADKDIPDGGDDTGLAVEAGEHVMCPPFDATTHIRDTPDIGLLDVTAEITKRLFGKAFEIVVGQDYGTNCTAIAFRFLSPMGALDDAQMWAVNGWYGGDEQDMSEAMIADGFSPDRCLLIGDCSMTWQSSRHNWKLPPSFDQLQALGWTITGPTERKTATAKGPRNPDKARSINLLRVALRDGKVFCTPAAQVLSRAFQKCEGYWVNGNLLPKENTRYSHPLDAAKYCWFWYKARPHLLEARQRDIVTVRLVEGRKPMTRR